jgi:hypothetical protein
MRLTRIRMGSFTPDMRRNATNWQHGAAPHGDPVPIWGRQITISGYERACYRGTANLCRDDLMNRAAEGRSPHDNGRGGGSRRKGVSTVEIGP